MSREKSPAKLRNPLRNRITGSGVVRVDDLLANPQNWRLHPDAQQQALAGVIDDVGFVRSILVNTVTGHVVDGHARIAIAMRSGVESLPVEYVELSEAEEATVLATLDPIGAMAAADRAKLDDLMRQVQSDDERVQALMSEIAERDGLEYGKPPKVDDPGAQVDKAEELRAKWGVESGQLWQLGDHRLICGDCTDAAVVARVMDGKRAQLCLTDPPYGLGEKKDSGKNDYDQYNDTRENLADLARSWLPIARDITPVVVFFPGVTNAWIYPPADWVMCWFYAGGQLLSPWGFNCWQPLLCYGKDPSLAAGKGGRPDAVEMNVPANSADINHPCPKPLKLWLWLVERLSFGEADILYEPFSGSGTTIIACEQLGRRCRAIEISAAYCAVALERWAAATGKQPHLID